MSKMITVTNPNACMINVVSADGKVTHIGPGGTAEVDAEMVQGALKSGQLLHDDEPVKNEYKSSKRASNTLKE